MNPMIGESAPVSATGSTNFPWASLQNLLDYKTFRELIQKPEEDAVECGL
jgi:hypothetical protein